MIHTRFLYRSISILLIVLYFAVCFSGCSGTPTPFPSPTPLPSTPTVLPQPSAAPTSSPTPLPTAVPTATATRAPTATLVPTQTPTPIPESVSAWCMPAGFAAPVAASAVMPPQATAVQVDPKGTLRLKAPVSSCTFVYTFSQPVSNDLDLHVYDRASQPFLKVKLVPVTGSPNKAAVTLTHSYIIDPPFWEISYRFLVMQLNNTKRREDQVVVYKATPPLCWNERLPDPVTLQCPNLDGDWNVDRPETWKGRDW